MRPRLLAALALLTLAHGGSAQEVASSDARTDVRPVAVEVGTEPLGIVPPLATSGFNYGNAMQVVGYEDDFARIRVDTLRYPPGNQADEIHVGPHDLDALAMNLDLLGRPPVLMVTNLFGGSPEEAAGLARLAREKGIEVLAWEIGNEPDLYASNRGDPSWTPERWCGAFRAQREAILEVDPAARFAGPAVSGSRPAGETFLRDALRLCGDVIDILTWHVYPTDGTLPDEEALATSASFGDEFARYRGWANDPVANPLGHDRDLAFGVTEFGLSWRSAAFRHLEDQVAALWLADVLGQMASMRLDVSHYFTLQAMGGHGLIDIGGWVRPTYHVYDMLSSFTGEALPVRTDAPLRAYAVRNEGGIEVLLVNPGTEALRARLRPASSAGDLRVATLSEPIFDEHHGPLLATVPARSPVPVPPRAVVRVRVPAP